MYRSQSHRNNAAVRDPAQDKLGTAHQRRADDSDVQTASITWGASRRRARSSCIADNTMIKCRLSPSRTGRVAELADALDLKSSGGQPSCGFESRLGHFVACCSVAPYLPCFLWNSASAPAFARAMAKSTSFSDLKKPSQKLWPWPSMASTVTKLPAPAAR
jgi:hypothetical protein